MSNVAGWCASFKRELLCGIHALGTPPVRAAATPDTLKAALYYATSDLSPASISVYTTTGECTGGGYTAGGVNVTNGAEPAVTSLTAYWTPSAAIVFADITQSDVDAVLIYNSTQGNKAVGICKFGVQSVVAGTLTLTMPANSATTALMRIS